MNKILTFCRTHDYNILGARPTDTWHLNTTRLIVADGNVDQNILPIIETEKLFAGWEHTKFQAFLWVFKGKWIGFVDPLTGATIMKLQASTLPALMEKILNKFTNESTLPSK